MVYRSEAGVRDQAAGELGQIRRPLEARASTTLRRAPKLTAGQPYLYFEMTFNVRAGSNSTNNDSAWVRFSDNVDASGAAVFRIGSTSATMFNLEDCTGCGLSGVGPTMHSVVWGLWSTSPRGGRTRSGFN